MKNGFTLIEILVVVGIMGILAVVGVASYNRIGDRSKSQQTAQLIATHLRSAQKDADSGSGAELCAPGIRFGGVIASYDAVNELIRIRASCGTNPEIRTIPFKLGNGVTVSGFGTVTFLSVSGGISPLPADISVSTSGANTFVISFTSAGGIDVSP